MKTPAGPDSRNVQIVRPDDLTGCMNSERMDGSDNAAIGLLSMYIVTKGIAGVLATFMASTLRAGVLSAQSTGVVSHETLLHTESALESQESTPEEEIPQILNARFQPEKVEAR